MREPAAVPKTMRGPSLRLASPGQYATPRVDALSLLLSSYSHICLPVVASSATTRLNGVGRYRTPSTMMGVASLRRARPPLPRPPPAMALAPSTEALAAPAGAADPGVATGGVADGAGGAVWVVDSGAAGDGGCPASVGVSWKVHARCNLPTFVTSIWVNGEKRVLAPSWPYIGQSSELFAAGAFVFAAGAFAFEPCPKQVIAVHTTKNVSMLLARPYKPIIP